MYLLLSFLFLGRICISQVFVEGGDESSRCVLSLLVFLLLFSSLGLEEASLGLKGQFSSLSIVSVGLLVHSSNSGKVRVECLQCLEVFQWVLLLLRVDWLVFSFVSDGTLDGIRVDDLGNIRVGQDSSVEMVSTLFLAWGSVATEDLVKGREGRFSPDDESSEVATWSQLSQVKSVDIADFNTWDVSDGSEESDVFVVVNEKWALTELVSSVSELAFTSSDDLSVGNSFNIFVGTESLQESNDVSGLFDTFDLVVNNQWEVGDTADSVASSQNERSQSGSSQGSSDGVSLLLDVDFSVPSSPGLQWSEHSTFSTRVGEGTLSGSGSTTSTNSWYSCDGTTWTPRDSGVLHTSLSEDSVSLTGVLGDLIMDKSDDIESDGSSADSWKGNLVEDLLGVLGVENGDGWSC